MRSISACIRSWLMTGFSRATSGRKLAMNRVVTGWIELSRRRADAALPTASRICSSVYPDSAHSSSACSPGPHRMDRSRSNLQMPAALHDLASVSTSESTSGGGDSGGELATDGVPPPLLSFCVAEDEDEEEGAGGCGGGRAGVHEIGVTPNTSPLPTFGEGFGASPLPPFGEGSPRRFRTCSSLTMRLEYQTGPSLSAISVTGGPSFRPDLDTYTSASMRPLSAPLRTSFSTSSRTSASGHPTALAISFNGQRNTPYSSESCSSPITSIHAPRAAQEQRRSLALLRQSAG